MKIPGLGELNERELRFTKHYLAKYYSQHYTSLNMSVKSLIESIQGNTESDELVKSIRIAMDNELLPIESFNWIETPNTRLCYFVQIKLHQMIIHARQSAFPLSLDPKTIKHKIIEIFDLQITFPTFQFYKAHYLDDLKQHWSQTFFSNKNRVGWIDKKNEIQISWLWDYLIQKNLFYPIPLCTNTQDKYIAIVGLIDLNGVHDGFMYHIEKAKAAWNQKKHRDKRKGKKAYNFVLTTECRDQLSYIAKQNDQKINDTLERIISEEHKRMIGIAKTHWGV